MSARDRWLLLAMILCLAITTILSGTHFNRIDARLDAIERTTNVLMQWSAYRAWTNATFTSIERTNAPVLH